MAGSEGKQGSQGGQKESQRQGQGSQRMQGGQSTQGTQGMQGSRQGQGSEGTQQFTDPVCGMNIGQEESVGTSSYQGQTYHFCSEECKQEFDRSPQQYARRTA